MKEEPQEEVDRLSDELAENHERMSSEEMVEEGLTLMNPERFSNDTIGHDDRAFIALAMEAVEEGVEFTPFSAQITIETRRARVILSFESPQAAADWLNARRNEVLGVA